MRTTLSFPSTSLSQSPGWIAPNGRFFPCCWYEHDSRAEELAKRYYPAEVNLKSGTQIFEERLWVRLLDNGSFHVGSNFQGAPRITQAQRDQLFDLANLNLNTDFGRRLLFWLDGAEDTQF